MKFLIAIIFSISILFFAGCDTSNKPATGLEDEIFVVADSLEYLELETALDSTFQKIINTPQPEKLFTLKRVSANQIDKYKHKKNLILLAPLNSSSSTARYIKSVIDKKIEDKISTDPNYVVTKKDLWAKNQLVMILSAPTMQELEFKILKDKDNLLYAFQNASDKRLYESLYSPTYERKNIEGKLLRDFGWLIYVQADFKLAMSKPEDNFVWLRRSPGSDMERWIFVHWIENADPSYLNVDSIRSIRNRLTKKYYQTSDDTAYVVIAEDYFTNTEVNFKGRYALLTQGLWDLNIKGMGGPFINYIFYDEKSKRIYMLDASVYAPKYYKRNLLQQLDVTLQSFMTKSELNEDRIDELLDASNDEELF